jgi:hypothetical protein
MGVAGMAGVAIPMSALVMPDGIIRRRGTAAASLRTRNHLEEAGEFGAKSHVHRSLPTSDG